MNFNSTLDNATRFPTGCLVAGLYAEGSLPKLAQQVDKATGNLISQLRESGDVSGKAGKTLVLHQVSGLRAKRLILVGFGKRGSCSEHVFRQAIESALAAVCATGADNAAFFIDDIEIPGRDALWKATCLAQCCEQHSYRYTATRSNKNDQPGLDSVTYGALAGSEKALNGALATGSAIGIGVNTARELGNLPGNICTPRFLAQQAMDLSETHDSLSVDVLDEQQMEDLGMGSLLSVSRGSAEPARLIVMRYQGGEADEAPYTLVGKGITFDSGGISLKPGAAMDEMKFDMCGAASVLGTMASIIRLAPSINVIGVIAAAENMPGGKATRPGDIVTTLAGKTVEILNTDAEGRLVLCDALTYVERFKPAAVIDIATLTGACVIALGAHASGLMSNNQALADSLLASGEESCDRAWQLPLWKEYQKALDSNFADMQNIGDRSAGTITAGCFLSRFTESYPWAHLDIAGTAWLSGAKKGATGRPVPLLVRYLLNRTQ